MYFSFRLLYSSFLFGCSLYFLTLLKTSNFSLCESVPLPSSLIIFMIITLNSWVDCLSPLHFMLLLGIYLLWNMFLCCLIFPNLLFLFLHYLVGWLYFPTLEKWPALGDIPCVPAAHSPLVTQAVCSRDSLYEGCLGPSVVGSYVGGLAGLVGPQSGWLPGPALCGGGRPLVGRGQSWGG